MRNFTVADGVIQSPSFPNDYPNNADCVYVIQVSQDRVIQLTFNNISIGYRYNRNICYGDYIEVSVILITSQLRVIFSFLNKREQFVDLAQYLDVLNPYPSIPHNLDIANGNLLTGESVHCYVFSVF